MLMASRNWLFATWGRDFCLCQRFGFMVEMQGSSIAVNSCWLWRTRFLVSWVFGVETWCEGTNTRVLVRRNREPTWRSLERLSILVRGCVVHSVLIVVSLVWRKIVWPKHLLLEIFHCAQLRPIARFRSIFENLVWFLLLISRRCNCLSRKGL